MTTQVRVAPPLVLVEAESRYAQKAKPANASRPTVTVTNLGCKVNAYETELIKQNLERSLGEVDVHVINTCTVTREADRQSRQAVRRAVRSNPKALIIVTGCYAQMEPQACAEIDGVNLVLGNARKLDVHQLLPALIAGTLPHVMVDAPPPHATKPPLLSGYEGRSRAFLHVQQGCDQSCTFCIIHKARGPAHSLPLADIKRQAQTLLQNGYKELVLCGVDLGSWGADLVASDGAPLRFADVVREVVSLSGDFRVRLSSLDPIHLEEDLLQLWAEQAKHGGKLCPHLHLSMQSANTLILKRMRRRYTREELYARVRALRARVPDLTISADVMVGFPTESDAHFADTLQAIDDLAIAWPHVFPYSERTDTPAARIPLQVPVTERRRRAELVRESAKAVRHRLFASQQGQTMRVLVEGQSSGLPAYRRTRAANYVPVYVPGITCESPGQFMDVHIRRLAEDMHGLVGECVAQAIHSPPTTVATRHIH